MRNVRIVRQALSRSLGGFFGAVHRWLLLATDLALLQRDLELEWTDAENVSGLQLALADDARTIDIGAVLAAEIANRDIRWINDDRAVVATDHVATGPHVAIFCPTNKECLAGDCHFLTGVLSLHDLELQLH